MKTINLAAMNSLDHDDVKDNASTDAQRQKYRVKIIKQFLKWSK